MGGVSYSGDLANDMVVKSLFEAMSVYCLESVLLILASLALLLSGPLSFVAYVWQVVLAFKRSILWGLGSLLVPAAGLVYLLVYWKESRIPAILAFVSILSCLFSTFVFLGIFFANLDLIASSGDSVFLGRTQ